MLPVDQTTTLDVIDESAQTIDPPADQPQATQTVDLLSHQNLSPVMIPYTQSQWPVQDQVIPVLATMANQMPTEKIPVDQQVSRKVSLVDQQFYSTQKVAYMYMPQAGGTQANIPGNIDQQLQLDHEVSLSLKFPTQEVVSQKHNIQEEEIGQGLDLAGVDDLTIPDQKSTHEPVIESAADLDQQLTDLEVSPVEKTEILGLPSIHASNDKGSIFFSTLAGFLTI